MSDIEFAVVSDAEREKTQRHGAKNKRGPMFDALWAGQTLRLSMPTDDFRVVNSIRSGWSHLHRGTPIHVVRASDGNGWVAWADVNGPAKP